MPKILRAADLFCGAGGTSAGAEKTGGCRVDFAVNHWDVAVETHQANFPHTKHVNSRLDQVNPGDCGKIDLLFASPECTHFSGAAGGRPTSDQQRAGAWDLMRWIAYHRPSWIVVENVREFKGWGPVNDKTGRPIKALRGKIFDAWLTAIRAEGYKVDYRMLNAADFGAHTSRDRLFVIARKGNRNPVFPEPTHCRQPGGELPGLSLPRWKPAHQIIDWNIPCRSIFGRRQPLKDSTLLRIEAGLRRFVGPFQVVLRNNCDAVSLGSPVGTITAGAKHHGVAVPFMTQIDNTGVANGSYIRSIDRPIHTLTTKANACLVVPFVVPYRGERDGQTPRTHGIAGPLPTITTEPGHGLAVPLVMSSLGGGRARDAGQPIPTLTANGGCHLIVPYLIDTNHGEDRYLRGRTADLGDALGTITAHNGKAICIPYLVHYYGTENISPTGDPLDTITTRDRHGLSIAIPGQFQRSLYDECLGHCWDGDLRAEFQYSAMGILMRTMHELGIVDIGFRMLKNPELAAAQGFDPDYVFCGKTEFVTKQIGNSVSPPQAEKITEAILAV